MSVNKAILIGRLGKDPELKYTQSGKAVVNYSLATSERWSDQSGEKKESTTWHNVVAWGKQAEVMNEYLKKGQQVYIEGRIDNRSYDDKDGNKRYISEVVVQSFQFISSRGDGSSSGSGSSGSAQNSSAGAATGSTSATGATGAGGSNNGDDDLPF